MPRYCVFAVVAALCLCTHVSQAQQKKNNKSKEYYLGHVPVELKKTQELKDMETVFRRPLAKEFTRFKTSNGFNASYVKYKYDGLNRRKRVGRLIATLIPPIPAAITALAMVGVVSKHRNREDEYDGYDEDDNSIFSSDTSLALSMTFIGTMGLAFTLPPIIVGLAIYGRARKYLMRMEPYLYKTYESPEPVVSDFSLSPLVSGRGHVGLQLGFKF